MAERRTIEQKLQAHLEGRQPPPKEEQDRLKARFRQINPKAAADCQVKVAYPSKEEALRHPPKSGFGGKENLRPYICGNCGKYHIGREYAAGMQF